MPAPPNTNDSMAVSARNIIEMKPFFAPTARIMPISAVRSMAAMLRVFTIMMIATKNRNMTNMNSAAFIKVAMLPTTPSAFFHETARTPSFFSLRTVLSRASARAVIFPLLEENEHQVVGTRIESIYGFFVNLFRVC